MGSRAGISIWLVGWWFPGMTLRCCLFRLTCPAGVSIIYDRGVLAGEITLPETGWSASSSQSGLSVRPVHCSGQREGCWSHGRNRRPLRTQ